MLERHAVFQCGKENLAREVDRSFSCRAEILYTWTLHRDEKSARKSLTATVIPQQMPKEDRARAKTMRWRPNPKRILLITQGKMCTSDETYLSSRGTCWTFSSTLKAVGRGEAIKRPRPRDTCDCHRYWWWVSCCIPMVSVRDTKCCQNEFEDPSNHI